MPSHSGPRRAKVALMEQPGDFLSHVGELFSHSAVWNTKHPRRKRSPSLSKESMKTKKPKTNEKEQTESFQRTRAKNGSLILLLSLVGC